MSRRRLAVLTVAAAALLGSAACGGGPSAKSASAGGSALLPDVRYAKDRPPVVLVSRDGDPSGAIAIAIATGGLDPARADDDAEAAVAIAGVVEARLAAKGLAATVIPSWAGVRATMIVAEADAANAAGSLHDTLAAPADDKDLAAAKKKLEALAMRPLPDVALARWARCVGSPYALPARAGKSADDLTVTRLEQWRAGATGKGRVAIAVAGPSAMGEAAATAVAKAPAWKDGAAPGTTPPAANGTATMTIDASVYEAMPEGVGTGGAPSGLRVHMALDVPNASRAVTTAEALGDPRGPLASRLAALDLPFRIREVTGAAEPRGGCVGVILEANAPAPAASAGATAADAKAASSTGGGDLALRVADAIALVQVEAEQHLAEGGSSADGRTLARRAGDAREAAERAAWWALADTWNPRGASAFAADPASPPAVPSALPMNGRLGIAVGLPGKRGAAPGNTAPLEPSRETLTNAIAKANASWQKTVADGRVRVEVGQGELWVLVASPCGTDAETDVDAGLTALVAMTAAETARAGHDVRVEPWIVPDGAGLLVHGPALAGETPAAHARRLADVAARSFASEPLLPTTIARARAELLRNETRSAIAPSLAALANALAPGHPSWFIASGREDTLARTADAAVIARAQALRAGPIRVAVLASTDADQGKAAVRAADRWIDRRGDAARACRPGAANGSPKPGTYAVEARGGTQPEAFLAFPLPENDEAARASAQLVAAALDGDGGLLEKAVGTPGLARAWSARVLGGWRAPALVVRLASSQASLDGAVMQARALVDRIHKVGLGTADFERAASAASREAIAAALDPRGRLVLTFRGEVIPSAAQPAKGKVSPADVTTFAQKSLGEEGMIVVASRPKRPIAGPPVTPESAKP